MSEQGKGRKRSYISIDLKSFNPAAFPISKRTDPKTPVW